MEANLSEEIVFEFKTSQNEATHIPSEIIVLAEIIFALIFPANVNTGVLVAEIER